MSRRKLRKLARKIYDLTKTKPWTTICEANRYTMGHAQSPKVVLNGRECQVNISDSGRLFSLDVEVRIDELKVYPGGIYRVCPWPWHWETKALERVGNSPCGYDVAPCDSIRDDLAAPVSVTANLDEHGRLSIPKESK